MKTIVALLLVVVASMSALATPAYRALGLPPEESEEALITVSQLADARIKGLIDKASYEWGACWTMLRAPRDLSGQREAYCADMGDLRQFPPIPDALNRLLVSTYRPGMYVLPLKTPATHPEYFQSTLAAQPRGAVSVDSTTANQAGYLPPPIVNSYVPYFSSVPVAPPANSSFLAPPTVTPSPLYVPPYQQLVAPWHKNLLSSNPRVYQVNGYSRSNGTYVAPYLRTAPDGNQYNNLSRTR